MTKGILFSFLVFSLPAQLLAQGGFDKEVALPEMVITATKTERSASDLPIPIAVISAKEIKAKGIVRLDQLLAEQPGLALVSDVTGQGKGIQIQGFDPAYTMIMIDGDPLIGRIAGTLDLSRIALGNIERVEITKGPSSSLYGSDALGGVINLITKAPSNGLTSTAFVKYGSFNASDMSIDAAYKKDKLEVYQFIDRFAGNGYKIKGGTNDGFTIPPFQAYTYQTKLAYRFNDHAKANISAKLYTDRKEDKYRTSTDYLAASSGIREYTLVPSYSYRFNNFHKLQLRSNNSVYMANDQQNRIGDNTLLQSNYFKQFLFRNELQYNWDISETFKGVSGAGIQNEAVEATRYPGRKQFESTFAYTQLEAHLGPKLEIITGARFDKHNIYGSQFNPKLAVGLQLAKKLKFKASVGRGYKTPDFRQLYLVFTNPAEGYSVFGVNEVGYKLAELQEQGQIGSMNVDLSKLSGKLDAERSWSYNAGFAGEAVGKYQWELNLFRNNISNLIEVYTVALTTSAKQIFSYRNLASVRTQGVELSGKYWLATIGTVSAGYQFMLAEDLNQLQRIKNGQVFRRVGLYDDQQVSVADYKGLANRSRHMANVAFSSSQKKIGLEETVRLNYRGTYGFTDINGNNIIDAENELVKGYATINVAVSKFFFNEKLRVQTTVDNLLNYKDIDHIPGMPGRLFNIILSYKIDKKFNQN